jgi:hydrogenase expression/formation protein HypC
MCLAIPGNIISINGDDPFTRMGKVNFAGVIKDVSLAYVPDAGIGDYVIVHAGFAISVLAPEEANRVFEYLEEIDDSLEPEADK